MKKNKFIIIFITIVILLITTAALSAEKAVKKDYKIIDSYSHDSSAFTQGFEFKHGFLYEGTGLYGQSSLRKTNLKTGEIVKKIILEQKYFGEGITILNEKIYQLTWKENTAFVYDLNFNLINNFSYNGEGWGLTNDGENLIMSDGSEFLFYRDPEDFSLIKKIKVKFNNKSLNFLNELEYHNGYIYANIWQQNYIVKIKVQTNKKAKVVSYLDLTNILKNNYPQKPNKKIDVLNGIAYLPKNNSFLITGKLWPKIFEINVF